MVSEAFKVYQNRLKDPVIVIHIQNGNVVLNRLVTCLKMHRTSLLSTPGPVSPSYVSKNDDEEL